jgi:hypothetical protein
MFSFPSSLLELLYLAYSRKWASNGSSFFYVVLVAWIIIEVAPKFGWTKNCPLTDLEYFLRRHHDPSESWVRTKTLPVTIIFNITGIEVPDFVFTAIFGIIMATAMGIVIAKTVKHQRTSRSKSGDQISFKK